MRPEDVPAELVEKAKRALVDAAVAEAPHLPVEAIAEAGAANLDRTIRVILAGALPEIQAQALRDHRARAERFYADITRVSKAMVLGDLDDYAARLTTTTEEPT